MTQGMESPKDRRHCRASRTTQRSDLWSRKRKEMPLIAFRPTIHGRRCLLRSTNKEILTLDNLPDLMCVWIRSRLSGSVFVCVSCMCSASLRDWLLLSCRSRPAQRTHCIGRSYETAGKGVCSPPDVRLQNETAPLEAKSQTYSTKVRLHKQ